MSENFLNALTETLDYANSVKDNHTLTENGAIAFKSTNSKVLDFFATGGALRERGAESAINTFRNAFDEDPQLALRALFYFRDIRGGQGERSTFRMLINWLANFHPEAIKLNVRNIAEFGRWDDLYSLVGTDVEQLVWDTIDVQLAHDIQSDTPSLLGKWLKSENTSSKESKRLGKLTRKALEMSPRHYRKMLTGLRAKIGLVETKISNNEWDDIDYGKIPSKAGLQYRKAFYRHDEDGYSEFIEQVNNGEATMNAGTLYPYEIVEKLGNGMYQYDSNHNDTATLDAMWSSLPDYFEGTETRGLVVADVSGSMSGRPMDVSISLAIYTAERNKGVFHNKFITFSENPVIESVEGNTIAEKVRNLSRANWDMSTNIEGVFDLILDTAVNKKVSQDELPTHLYIISDMEFDAASGSSGWRTNRSSIQATLFEEIADRYSAAGYKMPFLVFWNVNSRNEQQPMSMDQRGFQMVSGCSPSIFKSLLSNSAVSAYDLMLEVLNSERYSVVKYG